MKIIYLIFSVLVFLTSCGSSKKPSYAKYKVNTDKISKQQRVVSYAKSYIGTRYKFGGETKKGMDCSGLVYTSFRKINVQLPRVSFDMSKRGKLLKDRDIRPGDLVFFKTSKKSRRSINHVGLVSSISGGNIRFVHSSTSKGVIESNLNNPFWRKAYRFARRVL